MAQSTQKPKLMVENISCILPQQSHLGALFLGNVYGAQNPTILKQYGIRAVLTSSIETGNSFIEQDINYQFQDIPFHMKIQAHDKENYNLKEHINKCIDFIEKARQLTNVYVHCFAGVSRSAAIVCAYIMWKLKWNYETTIAFVKAKRIVAKPNQGFVRQLLEVQEIILGQSSYISNNDQYQVEKSPSIISQVNTNSIATKQPLHYLNATIPVEQHQSKQIKKQNNVQQRASSALVINQPVNGIQKNIENQPKIDQPKYTRNSFQSSTFTPQRVHNAPQVTSQPINAYQSLQAPVEKNQKTDRFLYLQNFFPQNHLNQQAPHNAQKSTPQNHRVTENTQKPRNNSSLNSTGQNWMASQNSQQFYATSTQGFKNIQNQQSQQGSAKNLMNPVLQKGVSSTSQLILGGKKPIYSHNSTPVPKVLQKRQHQKSNHHLQRASELPPQMNNRTMMQTQHQQRASQGIEIMPKVNEYMWSGGNQQQKFSIRNMLSEQNLKSPVNSNVYNKKFDFRNATTTDGFYNSKSTSQQKQSQKTTSRLLVRPKDLPGYKNY